MTRIGLALCLVAAQAAFASDFRKECLNRLGAIEKKMVGLAETTPAEKYTWRPGEGVRSTSEVFLHVAALSFGAPSMFGTPPPEGFSFRGYDKSTTDKSEVVARLKASFAHSRKAIEAVSAADADKMVKRRRGETTMRNAMWSMLAHLSEHLAIHRLRPRERSGTAVESGPVAPATSTPLATPQYL